MGDTGGFLASCMSDNDSKHDSSDVSEKQLPAASLRPITGSGWKMALRVRHLHARVRRSILQSKTLNWDIKEFGIPINQEDMSGTLLAFSVNVLLGIEFVAGIGLTEQEQLDCLALWRYIGWLLGVETQTNQLQYESKMHSNKLPPLDPCSGTKTTCKSISRSSPTDNDPISHSFAMLESIVFHLLDPNEAS